MKVIKLANGKSQLKLSKSEWLSMGERGGWIRKRASMNYPAHINYSLEVGGELYELEVDVTITSIDNDGIGPYEYWGEKGFDKGNDYVGDFEIDDVKFDYSEREMTPELKAKIISILNDDDAFAKKVREEVSADQVSQYARDAKDAAYEDKYESMMKDRHFNSAY